MGDISHEMRTFQAQRMPHSVGTGGRKLSGEHSLAAMQRMERSAQGSREVIGPRQFRTRMHGEGERGHRVCWMVLVGLGALGMREDRSCRWRGWIRADGTYYVALDTMTIPRLSSTNKLDCGNCDSMMSSRRAGNRRYVDAASANGCGLSK
jgi:hypothetical protein